ncbi:MAG: peptidoglycan-binding protein, partial [Gemmobacter sp.]
MRRILSVLLLVLAAASPALAQRSAIAVLNGLATDGDAVAIDSGLRAAGFAAATSRLATTDAMRRTLAEAPDTGLERLAVVLTGRFVHSARGAWFLGAEAPPVVTLATADAFGLNLVTLAEIAAATPGGALLLLGDTGAGGADAGLVPGVGPANWLPPGVTLVRGPDAAVTAFARDALLRPGVPLASLVAARPGLTLVGPGAQPFLPGVPAPPPASGEEADWSRAVAAGTEAGFAAFLNRWPDGRYAAEARAAIAAIRVATAAPVIPLPPVPPPAATPDTRYDPAADEARLNLSRDARVAIQQALTALGYNTRGIDGIFGPGTRSAISAWQSAGGRFPTGYLDIAQLTALQAEAAAAAREAEDRRYWEQYGSSGNQASVQNYLNLFPLGVFALLALEQLANTDNAPQADQAAWAQARAVDTIPAYRAYLAAWPRGAYANAARTRIAILEGQPGDRAAWNRATAINTQAAYRAYLDAWPRGAYAAEARNRIAALSGSAADRAAWADAQRANTIPAYRAYLSTWPRGTFAAEARARIEALQAEGTNADRTAWERALAANTVAGYRGYLSAFPRGTFAAEARARIEALQAEGTNADRTAWERALAANTVAGYRGYLSAFPRGTFAAEARARIEALQAEGTNADRTAWER